MRRRLDSPTCAQREKCGCVQSEGRMQRTQKLRRLAQPPLSHSSFSVFAARQPDRIVAMYPDALSVVPPVCSAHPQQFFSFLHPLPSDHLPRDRYRHLTKHTWCSAPTAVSASMLCSVCWLRHSVSSQEAGKKREILRRKESGATAFNKRSVLRDSLQRSIRLERAQLLAVWI